MEFDVNKVSVANTKRMLDPKLVKKAEPRAINKTAKMARTAQSKEIRKVYNISAKRLNEELEKVSGPNRATPSYPRAVIRAKKLTKSNPGLQHYKAKQTRKGISYSIRKDKARQTRLHAFKSDSFTTQGIFLRSGDKRIMTKGRHKGKMRQPIIRQTGPSVVQMTKRVGIKPIRHTVKVNFSRLFFHEYKRERDKTTR